MKKILLAIMLLIMGGVIQAQSVTLNIRALMQGFYQGAGTMTAVIDPINQPTLCDSMTVRILDTAGSYNVLFTNTSVLSTSGYGTFNFTNVPLGRPYFIQLVHRNSLTVFSKYPIYFNSNSFSIDFTQLPFIICQSAKNSGDGYALMYCGDVNQDGYIDSLDASIMETAVLSVSTGYIVSDINGDHIADGLDFSVLQPNMLLNLWGGHPNSCLTSGLNDLLDLSSQIIIYPNPAMEFLTVTFSKASTESSKMKIFNMLGKEIMEQNLTIGLKQTVVDVSNLSSGVYFYKLLTHEGVAISKFIKE